MSRIGLNTKTVVDPNEGLDSEGRYWRIPKWFPDINSDLMGKLRAFHAELIHFNGRMNLISPRTEKTADLVHIADGILGSRAVLYLTDKKEIYDFGAGNGIPGLITALLDPDRRIVMIDSDARKIEFLKHCSFRLGLKNCSVNHTRIEDLPDESVHCAISRGLSNISKSLILMRHAAANDCEYFHFKSESWSTEVAGIPSQVLAHWDIGDVSDYMLPDGQTKLSVVQTKRR